MLIRWQGVLILGVMWHIIWWEPGNNNEDRYVDHVNIHTLTEMIIFSATINRRGKELNSNLCALQGHKKADHNKSTPIGIMMDSSSMLVILRGMGTRLEASLMARHQYSTSD